MEARDVTMAIGDYIKRIICCNIPVFTMKGLAAERKSCLLYDIRRLVCYAAR